MDYTTLRSFKDFLVQYNQISETCFQRCVNHLSNRELSEEEIRCADMCTTKHVNVNHKVMQVYMEIQPKIVNKRIEDLEKQQAALEEAKKESIENEVKKTVLSESHESSSISESKTSSINGSKPVTEVVVKA